jgi:uncharacterized protein (DUF2252 family)
VSNIKPGVQDYDAFNTIEWAAAVAFPSGVDLSLYSALVMQVRVAANAPRVLIERTLGDGLVVTGTTQLAITVPLATVQTMKPGAYAYDIRGLRTGPVHDIILQGTIYVTDGVTR